MLYRLLAYLSVSLVVIAFEYSVNFDRLELAYYDRTLVKDLYFLFRKYNRTNYCLNISLVMLQDLNGNDMESHTKVYKWTSNQYKALMGGDFSYNVCAYWKLNMFGTTKALAKYGNLEGCDIKKGHYYLYNFMPETSQFPQNIPPGNYMMAISVTWKSKQIILLQWILEAKFILKNRKVKKR